MNECFRLLNATLLSLGLIGTAMAQPFDAERDFEQDFGSESEREFGRDAERDPPPARGDEEGRFRVPGGRAGRGPQPSPMFAAIDADGDGVITSRELRRAAAAIKSLDADGDGNITLEEASPQRGPGRGGPGGPGGRGGPGNPDDMIDRFMENDQNGDGVLSPDEVPQQMGRMLSGADSNGDGVVDREELTAAVENMQNRFRGRGGPGGQGRGGPGQGGLGGRGGNAEETYRRLMASDTNGDGLLSPQEVPQQMMRMLRGADLNEDGFLNNNEVRQAVARMGNRGGDRGRGRDRGRGGERFPGGDRGPGGNRGPGGDDRGLGGPPERE